MTKKQEALNKAKESGKKIVEGGKKFGKGSAQVIVGTSGAVGYALTSGYEKGASVVSKVRGNKKGISESERRKHRNNAEEYGKKAKVHIVEAGRFRKVAGKGVKKVAKGGTKVVWNTVKGGYHLIDAGDKAIGEKIEKKQIEKGKHPGKIGKFFRDNITKIMLILSLSGIGGYNAIQTAQDKEQDKLEVVDIKGEKNELKEFFKSQDVLKDLRSSGKERQDKRKNRYLGKDDAWNNMRNGLGYAERKKAIEGMCRMIESGDLEMIVKKADETGVPRQCVFLALAESCREAGANSGVAGGYWQFTEDSAKRFGLIDEQGNDYRSDPEKSTDAAMRHLKENYKIVCNYNRQLGYNMSESDKWIFAFHMYNGSPKLVRKGIVACKGNANEYSEKLQAKKKENNNYVPRILGMQDALSKIFKDNGYDTQKVRANCLNQKKIEKTEADLMYESFVKVEETLTDKERSQMLKNVEEKYKEEYKAGIISKSYYEGAIRVIGDAMISEGKEEEFEED